MKMTSPTFRRCRATSGVASSESRSSSRTDVGILVARNAEPSVTKKATPTQNRTVVTDQKTCQTSAAKNTISAKKTRIGTARTRIVSDALS
jgi:hypothetical protein